MPFPTAFGEMLCAMALLVATERLGWPGEESGRLERAGFVQRRLTYPSNPEEPTATCHLQRAEDEDALCGYQWEGLVRVPGATTLEDVPEWSRCQRCAEAATRA